MSINTFTHTQDGINAHLNLGCDTVTANTGTFETANIDTANISTVVVNDAVVNIVTLNNQASVPNPPVGKVSLFNTGTDLKSTNPLGTTVTYATTSMVGNYLPLNGSQSMTGNLNMGTNNLINANSLVINEVFPAVPSAGQIAIYAQSDNLFSLDSSSGTRQYLNGNDPVVKVSPASSVIGHIPAFAVTTDGKTITDSGIASSNLFLADGSVNMTGNMNMNSHILSGASDVSYANSTNSGSYGVCLGQYATITNDQSVSVGFTSSSAGRGVGVGSHASANNGGVAVGSGAIANIDGEGIAVGNNAVASGTASMMLGNGTNAINNTCCVGSSLITAIYPNSLTCTLGLPASPFSNLYVGQSDTAQGIHYVMSGAGPALTNTNVQTSLIGGSSIGSLTYANAMYVGQTISFNCAFTTVSVDSLVLTLMVNGSPFVTFNVPSGLTSITKAVLAMRITVISPTQAIFISTHCVGLSADLSSTFIIPSQIATLAFNSTSANTFDFRGQWSGTNVGDSVQLYTFFVETSY